VYFPWRSGSRARIYAEELRAQEPELAMTFRASMARELEAAGRLDRACVSPPTSDVYVVLHNRPTGTHPGSLGVTTEQLAGELLGLAGPAPGTCDASPAW
jgi:hypothetical protein